MENQLVELEKKISRLDLAALTRGLGSKAAVAQEAGLLEQLWDAPPIPKDKPLAEFIHEQGLKT